LDLNHFIGMARAVAGHQDAAGYAALFSVLRQAVDDGRVVVPLSGVHLAEMAQRITDPRQRADISAVMERLSSFHYLLGRATLARFEIEDGLATSFGEPVPPPVLPLVGFGFGRSFGIAGTFKIVDSGGVDVTDSMRTLLGSSKIDGIILEGERRMLIGPTDTDAVMLAANPQYRPEVFRKGMESRVAWEMDTRDKLNTDAKWRSGRLRDFVTAREVANEWIDLMIDVLGKRLSDGLPGLDFASEQMRHVITAMPQTQVAISVKTFYHHDAQRAWTVNDIYDIDALSAAFAYCDVVFTDKAVRNALAISKDLRGFGTFLPRTVPELTAWLAHPEFRTNANGRSNGPSA